MTTMRRKRAQNGCPAPVGACSHPTICEIHGCAALEARRNKDGSKFKAAWDSYVLVTDFTALNEHDKALIRIAFVAGWKAMGGST